MPTERDDSPALYDYIVSVDIANRRAGATISVERTVEAIGLREAQSVPAIPDEPGEIRVNVDRPIISELSTVRRTLSPDNISSSLAPALSEATGINQTIAENMISNSISNLTAGNTGNIQSRVPGVPRRDVDYQVFPSLPQSISGETVDIETGNEETIRNSVTTSLIIPIPERVNIRKSDVIGQMESQLDFSEISFTFDASEQVGSLTRIGDFLGRSAFRNTTANVDVTIDATEVLDAVIQIRNVSVDCREAGLDIGEDIQAKISEARSELNSVESELNSIKDEIESVVGQDLRYITPSDVQDNITEFDGGGGLGGGVGALVPGRVADDLLSGPTEPLGNLKNRLRGADPRDIDIPDADQSPDIPVFCANISQRELPGSGEFGSLRSTLNDLIDLHDRLTDLLGGIEVSSECPGAGEVSADVPDDLGMIPQDTISAARLGDRLGITGSTTVDVPFADRQRNRQANQLETVLRRLRSNVPAGCSLPELEQIESSIQDFRQNSLGGTAVDCANLNRDTTSVFTSITQLERDDVSPIKRAIRQDSISQDVSASDINSIKQEIAGIEREINNNIDNLDCRREFKQRLDEIKSTTSRAENQLSRGGGSTGGFDNVGGCASRYSDVESRVSSVEDLVGINGDINMAPLTPENVSTVRELDDEYIRTTTIDQFIIDDAKEKISTTSRVINSRVDDPNCAQNFQGRLDRVNSKFVRIVTTINAPVDCTQSFPEAECDVSFLESMVGINGTIKLGGFGGNTTNSAPESRCPNTQNFATEYGVQTQEEPRNIADMERVLRQEGAKFDDVLPEPFRREDFGLRAIIKRVENFTIDPDNINRGVDAQECRNAFTQRVDAVKRRYDRIVTVGTSLDITLCNEKYSDVEQEISELESRISRRTTMSDIQTELDSIRSLINQNVEETECTKKFNNRLAIIENQVGKRDTSDARRTNGDGREKEEKRLGCKDVSRELRNAVRSYEQGTSTFIRTPQLGDSESLKQESTDRIQRGQELITRVEENIEPTNPCRGELLNDITRSTKRLEDNLGNESVRVEVSQAEEQQSLRGQRIEEVLANIGSQSGPINAENVEVLQDEEES